MRAVDLIERKRDGGALTADELRFLVKGNTTGEIPDYQMAAFLMAVYFKGMRPEELAPWTEAMLRSGSVLDFSDLSGRCVDKHSTGGVGDKISLPLAPLVAACGVRVPMVSGRGLGHTGGTLDKLESIPGFSTQQSSARFRELVDTLGLGLIGQTADIAPADKLLYALRDVTATVESIPLIASSIMSKKLAEGIDALVLDVKVGNGAFMRSVDQARTLAETMAGIGQRMGKRVVAYLTDMNQPLGATVGNALEVRESVEILRGGGPADVRALTLTFAREMLQLGGVDPAEAERALDDGRALARFRALVEAQGGDPRVIDDPDRLPKARHAFHNFVFTHCGKAQAQAGGVGVVGKEGVARHEGHQTLDRLLGKGSGIFIAATSAGQPGPEKQAALRLVELDRVAQLAPQRLSHHPGAGRVDRAHGIQRGVEPVEREVVGTDGL
jgi:pyrimidine-nucleoside phosphorylase/thymidine phosphorylase